MDIRCLRAQGESKETRYSPSALKAVAYWDAPDNFMVRVQVDMLLITEDFEPRIASVLIRPDSEARDVICGLDRAAHCLLRNEEPVEGTELADRLDQAGRRFEGGIGANA